MDQPSQLVCGMDFLHLPTNVSQIEARAVLGPSLHERRADAALPLLLRAHEPLQHPDGSLARCVRGGSQN